MTKADIAELVSEQTRVTKKDAVDLVEEVLEIMKQHLAQGEEIKVAGFGKFEVKSKNPRRGRNPQTGEQITIDGRRVLTFKPSTILREKLNAQ